MAGMFGLPILALALSVSADPPAPKFVAHNSGEPVTGAVQRIDADGSVTLDGEKPAKIPGPDLVSLRRVGVPLPAAPEGRHVTFANGDSLSGEVLAIEDDKVRFKAALGGGGSGSHEMAAPLSALAVIWFQAPAAEVAEELERKWAGERRRRDVVLAKNGDTRVGTVKEMKPGGPLVLREDGKETRLDPGQIAAVVMNTDLARTLRPRGQYFRLVLINGARLSLLGATADGSELAGKTLFGADVKIALDQIVSLDVRQGKAVYLSDLKPKSYEHMPYLGVRWPYEMDRSVSGGGLRFGGNAFDKGIGLHSQSRLTFDLGGQYRRFEALVGLNERMGRRGSARIRVLVDGQERDIGARELTAAEARPIRVDVAGGKALTLVVEFGAGGDVGDHVDWAEARLIK